MSPETGTEAPGKQGPFFIQVPLTSATATTASVPSVAVPAAPRAILLLLIHLFGLGHLDFTLKAERTMGQATRTNSRQGLWSKTFADKHSDGQLGPPAQTQNLLQWEGTSGLTALRTTTKT